MLCCKENGDKIDEIIERHRHNPGSIIPILQEIQEVFNYLPKDILAVIAEKTDISPAKIYGVATFYKQFRLKPVGNYLILLCQGTACHVNGSKKIEETLYNELKIRDGETTEDGLFTLNNVACLGCCSLSPVMMINEETYGSLVPEQVIKIITELKNQANRQVV
ncbi:NADH dehydrogenase (ubiquinone), 24 kDa subunit [Alkaliphilus metalliredigens QYMF]|uniref:NADH dehydrogenase (Ubiquinone), 24 kDa subunit n=1 Tax=Alkaliphilus metalliredigens (strain QYMF) TaxID=293826 RepID=A6TSR6_ALKMQ|nr:NADH-quinone oxidoreductase subunit NuoE [Alkaliphilus metalliredigens]ABR49234.1 NADH dehydrogenase (ubiquinone), 24 kDa subunit [Alkaliphilus metalliredigens QYMF]